MSVYAFSGKGIRKVKLHGKPAQSMIKAFKDSPEETMREAIRRINNIGNKTRKNEVSKDIRTLFDKSLEGEDASRRREVMRNVDAMIMEAGIGGETWVDNLRPQPLPSEEEPTERGERVEMRQRRKNVGEALRGAFREAESRGAGEEDEEDEEDEREAKGEEDDDKPTRMVVREDEVLPTTPAELKDYIGTGDGVDERIRELHQRYKDNDMAGTFERLATAYEAGVRRAKLQDGVSMEGHEGFTPSESSVTGSSFTGSSFTGSTPPPSFVGGAGGAGGAGAPPPPPPAGGAPPPPPPAGGAPPPAGAPAAGGAPAGIGGHEAMEEKQGDEAVEEEDNAIKALKKSDTVMDDSFNISKIGRDSPDELNKHQVIYRKLIETLFVSHSYIRLENRMVQRPELIQMLDSDKEVELFNRAVKMVGVYADHLGIENPRYGIDAGVSTLKQQLIELYTCCYHVRKNLGRSDKKSALDSYNRVGVIVSASSMGLTLDSLLQWAQNNRSTAGDTSGLANQRLKKPLQNMNNSELSQNKGRRTIGDIFNGRVSGLTHSDKPYLLGGNNQHMGQIDEEGGSKFRRSILMPERKSEGDNQRWKSFNWRMARSKKFDRKKIC
jgi:hypothetical protein